MAINQANEILRFIYLPAELKELLKSPHYSATLHEIASDIIRIALLLEKGKLAEKVRVRCGLEEPEPAGPTQEEREAEELAKQQARIEQERVAEAEREKAATRHGVNPDDDVPF